MTGKEIYIADRIFTGKGWLEDHAILAGDGVIRELIPLKQLSSDTATKNFAGNTIVPSFIDLQIYGAYGKLLAVYPEADALSLLNEYCKKGGAAFCLAAVATNTKEVFLKCIDAVKNYWKQGGEGILGLHIEGPWLNPVKRGAHIESLIHAPTVEEVKELLNYGKGVIKMITVAPEMCSKEIIELILSYDVILSAGHSNATYEEAMKGFGSGITTATHLYNAMSPLQHRKPGLVGAIMDHPSAMASIIPDGYHVDFAAIRIAKKAMDDRLFVITDAVTETDKGYYQHHLAGDKYESAGILSGSALTMARSVQNLVSYCNISLAEALRMCSLYPAKVMKLDDRLGKIEKGYQAKLTVLDKDNRVVDIIS
ncbi:MAG: N-acetylglucosamine-6-phosphate deacetylase [Chitinophagaceae bacterium]|jgi:N-acetylglucosamine-6-phosphate deacetylase|nr:N-acetylglucosamine-6-phosphate deacetylase [Chitinophagaceae bacterium]OQY92416.1 MAG: N-acetylglucosamine-6-phosphate deacetylase [Sphingobacteriales bacterium UTBCD1]